MFTCVHVCLCVSASRRAFVRFNRMCDSLGIPPFYTCSAVCVCVCVCASVCMCDSLHASCVCDSLQLREIAGDVRLCVSVCVHRTCVSAVPWWFSTWPPPLHVTVLCPCSLGRRMCHPCSSDTHGHLGSYWQQWRHSTSRQVQEPRLLTHVRFLAQLCANVNVCVL